MVTNVSSRFKKSLLMLLLMMLLLTAQREKREKGRVFLCQFLLFEHREPSIKKRTRDKKKRAA